jgi:hypothetical protein
MGLFQLAKPLHYRSGFVFIASSIFRPTHVLNTGQQAIHFARQFINNRNGEVIIHAATGQVTEIITAT